MRVSMTSDVERQRASWSPVTAALAAVALTVGLAAPAAAHPRTEVLPPLGVDLTHQATDNVGFVARFHEHFGSAGGIVTSNDWNDGQEFFVVTDPRGVFTYDLTNPESPELLDFAPVNQGQSGTGAALGQEDPSTDGRLVLLDGVGTDGRRGMHILDITDPTDITVAGVYSGTDHTWTCVTDVATGNGCAYAYGRSDNIIDIRDPAKPVKVEKGWKTATGESGYAHDLTEIRPGLVMHAGHQPVLMDTTDPANPVKLVHVTTLDHDSPYDDKYEPGAGDPFGKREFTTFGYHSVEWAQEGRDAFLLMGTELASQDATGSGSITAGDDCNGEDQAVIETWDARPVLDAFAEMEALKASGMSHADARTQVFGKGDTVKFVRLDSYAASGLGTAVTGQAVTNVLYCAHWMEFERDFADGGRVVAGYYNRGARFMEVAPVGAVDDDGNLIEGKMTEIGWFTGADAYTGSAQWITDEVVYVMDYVRGMDIIKITDEPATSTYESTGSVSDGAMTMAELEAIGISVAPAGDDAPSGMLTIAGVALAAAAVLRRRAAA